MAARSTAEDLNCAREDGMAAEAGAARLFRAFGRAGRSALDVLLPPLCLGCRTRIMAHDALCPACWRRINFVRPPLCDRLGLPMPYDTGGAMVSAAAVADPPDFDRARAVASFDGLMRELIHAFKFHDTHHARRLFGRWLAEAGRELLDDADILVPVPLARWRLLTRRFNQAQILAAEAGRLAKKPVRPFALVRSRSTPHQVGLTRAQRQRNVASVFRVPANETASVSGKAIVLIDDVITTGATASAAALTLKRAGARRVDVLALAIVANSSS
jgi:ComF family protein